MLVAGAAAALYGLASAGLAGLMAVLFLALFALLHVLDGLLAPLLGPGSLSIVAREIGRLQGAILRDAAEPLLLAAAGLGTAMGAGTWLRRQRTPR